MMQDQCTKIMCNLDGYIIEGDRRYAFHPEKGCVQAPSFYLQEAINIMGHQKATMAELIDVLESARCYLDPSPIIQGKIDKAIRKAHVIRRDEM